MSRSRSQICNTFSAVAGLTFLLSGAAQAIVIEQEVIDPPLGNPPIFTKITHVTVDRSDVGAQFFSNWFLSAADFGGSTDLEAKAVWTVLSFSDAALTLSVDISNLTEKPAGVTDYNASILAFGFQTDPDTDASFLDPGSTFDGIGDGQGGQQSFPGGFKQIDACIFGAQNCSGGNVNHGLGIGMSDFIQIALTPDSGIFGDTIRMSSFPVKFQGTEGSFEFVSFPNTTTVPSPASLWLIGAGLFGIGLFTRRRNIG